MSKKIRGALWLMFCEADERYIDLTRVLLAMAVVSLTAVAGFQVFTGVEVDLLSLGGAYAGLIFGGGVGIGARARLEDGNPVAADVAKATQDTQ